jgi:GNAT superfamily N-acetyltransferase
MSEAYIKHEPLCVSLGNSASLSDDEDEDMNILSEGMSLIAESQGRNGFEDGAILGLCLNVEMSIEDATMLEHKSNNSKDEKFAKILKFLSVMDRQANMWERLCITRAMGVIVMAVDDAATGQGIGKALMERSRDVAKERGFPALRVDCTSQYSAKIAQRLGMSCVFSLPYEQYKGQEGQAIFIPPSPHTHFKMFVQKFGKDVAF